MRPCASGTRQKKTRSLSLFFAGEDWIAWTPGGYYAASANGERLMGWQVNKGPEALAEYYPRRSFSASRSTSPK